MLINEKFFNEDLSVPLYVRVHNTTLNKEAAELLLNITKTRVSCRLSSLNLFKKVFGEPKEVRQYTYENFIWSFTNDFCSLFFLISEQEGISIEVVEEVDNKYFIDLFKEVVERIELCLK